MTTKTTSGNWAYKVVKRMRGMQGEFFDFPTAATFDHETDARAYAERFAREQGAARVDGARIVVRARRGNTTVVTYYSADYVAGLRRITNRDGSRQLCWERVAS